MILVDFSNLMHRILFVSTMKTNHNVLEYRGMFLHMLFTNLSNIKKNYSNTYGDIVLCLDAKRSWRKDFYPEYKATRAEARDKNKIDFVEFYKLVEETLEVINQHFPFKVVSAPRAEGDDVIAIIVEHRKDTNEKTLIVTEDKDMRQLRAYPNVDIYKPIQADFDTSSMDAIDAWIIEHILIGDRVDNIPSIKKDTEFSVAFLKYLKKNDIHITDVRKFNLMAISKKLYSEFTEVDKKGKLDIFKAPLFGEAKARDFMKDFKDNLYANRLFIRNYVRNRKLIHFKYIPKDITESILDSYATAKFSYSPAMILEYFNKNSLKYLAQGAHDFYITTSDNMTEEEITEDRLNKLNDWFS